MSRGNIGFSDEELHRLTVLQGMLGFAHLSEALSLEVKIAGLVKHPKKYPVNYDGFAPEITGENRKKLLEYIKRVKESGIYS